VRRLLVTGGAGFIGCNFVHYWCARHPDDRVVVLDALTYAGHERNLAPVVAHPGFLFVHGDICDEALVDRVFEDEGIDTVVHLAAESHVDRSITGPESAVLTNIVGTHTLLKVARKRWDNSAGPGDSRFHHVSTDEVFGSLSENAPPATESHRYSPNSPYAASKAAADHLVRAYSKTYGLPVSISNCSNNFGPYQYPEKLIPVVIFNALAGRPIPLYGDGEHRRDWLFVQDHCSGIEAIIERGRNGAYYNIGADCELSNRQLIEQICAQLDLLRPRSGAAHYADLITPVSDRPGHDRRYALDAEHLIRDTGWRPSVVLEEGLRRTISWYLDNPEWAAEVGADGVSAERRGLD
jgi:dTDP-glucose 4,6-dehydratase